MPLRKLIVQDFEKFTKFLKPSDHQCNFRTFTNPLQILEYDVRWRLGDQTVNRKITVYSRTAVYIIFSGLCNVCSLDVICDTYRLLFQYPYPINIKHYRVDLHYSYLKQWITTDPLIRLSQIHMNWEKTKQRAARHIKCSFQLLWESRVSEESRGISPDTLSSPGEIVFVSNSCVLTLQKTKHDSFHYFITRRLYGFVRRSSTATTVDTESWV